MAAEITLTQAEASDLDECEQRIAKGMRTFVEVGTALLRIRDERLYRTTYGTFEDYCQQRWGFNRHRASQMITAAEVVTTVTTGDLPAPANEAQARELARVEPERRAEVWRETVERTEGRPTAAAVREVARPEPTRSPEPTPVAPVEPVATEPTAAPSPVALAMREAIQTAADRQAEPSPAVAEWLAADPNLALATWRKHFSGAITRITSITAFTPDAVADRADGDLISELHEAHKHLGDYIARVDKLRPTGLRLIGGGR